MTCETPRAKPARLTPHRLLTGILRPFWRFRRGLTLGAQGVVLDSEGRVLLVRHSYRPGWYFPGGGVERGETLEAALARELREEAGVTLNGSAVLHGVFANFEWFPGDHIAVFVARHWTQDQNHRRSPEISEARFFDRSALPEGTDPGVRRRLAEIFDKAPLPAMW